MVPPIFLCAAAQVNGTNVIVLFLVGVAALGHTVPLGTPQQFTATGTFSDSTTQDITVNVHWSSSSFATIANAPSKGGLATLNGTGTTTIGANSGGVTASTALTVQCES